MAAKRSILLFLFFSASLLSASYAGRQPFFYDRTLLQEGVMTKELARKLLQEEEEEVYVAHPRILKVKTNDYGNYDPTPALSKPPFKLIPN